MILNQIVMKERITQIDLRNNKETKQFETTIDGQLALIEYSIHDDRIFLTHTSVPKELSGRGVGSLLVKNSLEEIDRMNLKVVPACTFVKSFIQKHPEYRRLLATGIEV